MPLHVGEHVPGGYPGAKSPVILRPQLARSAAASSRVSVPSAAGSSHSPASRPVSGAAAQGSFPPQVRRNRVRSSTRRGLGLAFTGRSAWFPRARALHREARGQVSQRGGAVGQAHHGPQLHEGLVEVPHPGGEDGGDLPLGAALDLGVQDIVVAVQQPGGDPEHVAVHRGDGQLEGDGGDGPGGVVPDAGEGPQGVKIGGG